MIALNDTDRSPNFDDIVKVDIPFILTVGSIDDTHALEDSREAIHATCLASYIYNTLFILLILKWDFRGFV